MSLPRLPRIILTILLLTSLAGCNLPGWQNLPGASYLNQTKGAPTLVAEPTTTGTPSPPETLVQFQVQAPPGSSPDETVYLSLLDEVTGLAMNARPIPMQPMDVSGQPDGLQSYAVELPFVVGSVLKYRYERDSGEIRVAEHLSDGSPVRYRLYHVTGPGVVKDTISRWTDTAYTLPTGRIQGQATDADSGEPVPNLLIAAGGAQTVSASDGSFMLEGLPPGLHNLIGYAMDGAYQTFQQGAQVAEGSTTPTPIKLKKAAFANVVFVVDTPKGTLPVVPLRLAGNLSQLGNTFANLEGGMSSLAPNMPVLTTLPDGRYKVTLSLPVGADVEYKYTLGDGFWNAEHAKDGSFRLRQLIVPDATILIEDTIDSWSAGGDQTITFDLQTPGDTPANDFVSIQFNPLFGWTPPVPMWKLGENHWAYALYGPLNLPGDLSYRYCRNNQCGVADDADTAGPNAQGRTAHISDVPQTLRDKVNAWKNWPAGGSAELPAVESAAAGGEGYQTGFELSTGYEPVGASQWLGYRPSWDALLPQALDQIQANNANLVVFTPTWSYGRNAPGNELPILAPLPGHDPNYVQAKDWVKEARALGLNVAILPVANFAIPSNEWWMSAPLDVSWWQVWFEQYREFAVNFADLAESSGAQTLILGGEWLQPALPGEKLPDGSPTGAPEDAEARWSELIKEVRTHFKGQLAWALSYQDMLIPPPFLGSMDRIYLELPVDASLTIDEMLGQGLDAWLDVRTANFQALYGKPLVLAVSCPSDPDLQTQVDCYQTLLAAANRRDWISGFVSMGYYPPAALQDLSGSVHGKPAAELLGLWFKEMVK